MLHDENHEAAPHSATTEKDAAMLVRRHDDLLWRDQDRFPLSAPGGEVRLSPEAPSEPGIRPFAMREVRYSDGEQAFHRPGGVRVCPDRQIGVIDGRALREVYSTAPSMTKYDTDGQDVLVVDYAEDD